MPNRLDLADHASHDPSLLAAYAAGDASGDELATAAALVAGCAACGELHRDLRTIRVAMAELPAPARPRDFRLTADQAASLRPAGWRGIASVLAGPRFRFAAPLGTAMAALGLAGLLLTGSGLSLPPSGTFTSGAATSDMSAAMGGEPGTGPTSSEAAPAPVANGAASEGPGVAAPPNPSPSPAATMGGGSATAAPAPTGVTTLSSTPVPRAASPSSDLQAEGGPVSSAGPSAAVDAAASGAGGEQAGGPATTASPPVPAPAFSRAEGPSPAGSESNVGPLAAGLLLLLGIALGAARLIARRLI